MFRFLEVLRRAPRSTKLQFYYITVANVIEFGTLLTVFSNFELSAFYHVVPTHYVPMILRAGALWAKARLLEGGYSEAHFRATSYSADIQRGYSDVIHCTTSTQPPLLRAKLSRGFPHVRLSFPIDTLPVAFDLSRFNIARGRYLKSGKSPLPESPRNGRYIDCYELPAARSDQDKISLLKSANLESPGIEVLLHHEFTLPNGFSIDCGSEYDEQLVVKSVKALGSQCVVTRVNFGVTYPRERDYQAAVTQFVKTSLSDPSWRGNGLDYDRLR